MFTTILQTKTLNAFVFLTPSLYCTRAKYYPGLDVTLHLICWNQNSLTKYGLKTVKINSSELMKKDISLFLASLNS